MNMHFIKKTALLLAALLLASVLSGCITRAIDDLYSVPQPAEEYVNLQRSIDEILEKGAEYAAPTGGSHRQSVQLYDFDGDGDEEAVAFFRMNEDKPLKIYIFRNNDGDYEVAASIEGEGTSIESISYMDIDGDSRAEIIVGWTMSGDIRMLGVYSLRDFEATSLMLTDYYEYVLCDMDEDERADLTVVRYDRTAKYGSAETFFFQSDGEIVSSSTRLSVGLESVERVRSGELSDGGTAVYVEGQCEGGVVTDIIACIDGTVSNVTVNPNTGVSDMTVRAYTVYTSDINSDGKPDIPVPQSLPEQTEGTSYRIINWYNYSSRGVATKTLSTYHNYTDGWYLVLPNEWLGSLTIRREVPVAGERTVVFSRWNGPDVPVTDFLAIYTLTGDNRADKARMNGRTVLSVSGETIYAAKLLGTESVSKYSLSENDVVSRFRIIYSEWISG